MRDHIWYDTKAECEEAIEYYDNAPYELRHGEFGRPTLTPRYGIRNGKRKWYIFAEYCFCSGTFGAQKDGPYEMGEW